MTFLKRLVATMPPLWQSELKRLHFRRQIRQGKFLTWEPEFSQLPSLLGPGDWVLDVGANVGHYTKRLSELVGTHGRVIAFEPVPETFALLAANLQASGCRNVTLINAAVSDTSSLLGMSIPAFDTGLLNFYQAHLSESRESDLYVWTVRIDNLAISNRIALVKVDAEGHEAEVLAGMRNILVRDKPILIVEANSGKLESDMKELGYSAKKLPGSPNFIFSPEGRA